MKVQALPAESQMLSVEGYHLHIVGPSPFGWELHLYREVEGGFEQRQVGHVRKPQLDYGHTRHTFTLTSASDLGPKSLRAMSEVMYHAAKLLETADEGIAEEIKKREEQRAKREAEAAEYRARREKEMAEYRERRRIEQEAERVRVAEIYELVRWLEGQKFRLRRKGYRATVFGEIVSVNTHRMNTISEKNVSMSIELRTLEKLEIKYEDEKRYNLIYEWKEPVNAA